MRSRTRRFATGAAAGAGLLALWLLFLDGSAAAAQTLTTGAIRGSIVDEHGVGLDGVIVILSQDASGREITLTAARDGRFSRILLEPGGWTVSAERLGYVPVRVEGIHLSAGAIRELRIPLTASPPPITQVDRLPPSSVLLGGGSASVLSTSPEIRGRLPGDSPGTAALPAFWPFPGWHGEGRAVGAGAATHLVDGVATPRLDHPVGGGGPFSLLANRAATGAVHRTGSSPQDVELDGGVGATLLTSSRPGGNAVEGAFRGGLAMFQPAEPDGAGAPAPSTTAPWISASLSGPLIADTAHYRIAFDARRVQDMRGRSIRTPTASVVPTLSTWDLASAHGQLDWSPSEGHRFRLAAEGSMLREGPREAGLGDPHPGDPAMSGSRLSVRTTYLSALGEQLAMETRAGVGMERRALDPGPFGEGTQERIRVHVGEGSVRWGIDPELAGDWQATAVDLASTLHHIGERHHLKGGLAVRMERLEASGRPAGGWTFEAPSIEGFQAGEGLATRQAGSRPDVSLSSPRIGFFLQDAWQASGNLEIEAGVRVDYQGLPSSLAIRRERWFEVSGIDTAERADARATLSPRLSFAWRSPDTPVAFRGSFGAHRGRHDLSILADVLSDTGGVRVDRYRMQGHGPPPLLPQGAPDAGGTRLSLLGPRFEAPLARVSRLGMELRAGAFTRFDMEFEHRDLRFLPTRRDLNRAPGRWGVDPLGRDIHGEPTGIGDPHILVPGSDRRFPEFDVVTAWESTGTARWTGMTLGMEHHREGRGGVEIAYTISRTTDSTPFEPGAAAAHGAPAMIRATPGVDGGDPSWLEGPSDLDRPHHLRLSGFLVFPQARGGSSLGLRWNGISGLPFTPTAQAIPGATRGPEDWPADPIRIPSALAGAVASLEGEWPCLAELGRGRVERNACRTPFIHLLDLRAVIELPFPGQMGWTLEAEALDLLQGYRGLPDPVLFLVDGAGEAPPPAGDDAVPIPLRVNPGFGLPLEGSLESRRFRVGIGVRF